METLSVLEKKVISLIDIIKELKAENARLVEENTQLVAKLSSIEKSLTDDAQRVEELDQEKALTKLVVDDLIKSIETVIEGEKQL